MCSNFNKQATHPERRMLEITEIRDIKTLYTCSPKNWLENIEIYANSAD